MEDWTVLETFTSEAEARVAESFLRAQGFEVQLLDTHMNAYPPVSSTIAGRGMRLLVRAVDGDRARKLLKGGQRSSHLEIVGEVQPVEKSSAERWLFWLVLFALGLTIAVSYFK